MLRICLVTGPHLMVVLQDNATAHVSKKVTAFLKGHRVAVLQWPPLSPDLSPIENIWARLKRDVRAHSAQALPQLERRAKQAWRSIVNSPAILQPLFDSMPARLDAVLANGGGPTGY